MVNKNIKLIISLGINNEQFVIKNILLPFSSSFLHLVHRERTQAVIIGRFLCLFFALLYSILLRCLHIYTIVFFYFVTSMNIFTQLTTQFLINKNLLIQLLQTLNFSNDFIKEFRNNHIYIDEDKIRQRMRVLCDITQDESFKGLCCHDNGIQLVFYTTPREYRFIRFRISFDIKIISIILNNQQQSMQILISGIQIKSLNYLSKPFRFCIQVTCKYSHDFKSLHNN